MINTHVGGNYPIELVVLPIEVCKVRQGRNLSKPVCITGKEKAERNIFEGCPYLSNNCPISNAKTSTHTCNICMCGSGVPDTENHTWFNLLPLPTMFLLLLSTLSLFQT